MLARDDMRASRVLSGTGPQVLFVRALQKRLYRSNRLLDTHCEARFGQPFSLIDRRQGSELIDELKEWVAVPADLQRAGGQLDMFGDGGT